jgi:hypothetical protein
MDYHRLAVIRRDSMPRHPATESKQTEQVDGTYVVLQPCRHETFKFFFNGNDCSNPVPSPCYPLGRENILSARSAVSLLHSLNSTAFQGVVAFELSSSSRYGTM